MEEHSQFLPDKRSWLHSSLKGRMQRSGDMMSDINHIPSFPVLVGEDEIET